MYMSYCRYEGTAAELNVCLEDVKEHVYEEAEYEVSDREITNFKQMVTRFHEFMQEMDLINEYGELNHEELDRICLAMAKGYEQEDECEEECEEEFAELEEEEVW